MQKKPNNSKKNLGRARVAAAAVALNTSRTKADKDAV
jgi:hypothetical protein